MKQEHGMFLSYFFLSTNQSTRSRFVRSPTRLTEAEKRCEESGATVPVIYDDGSFSLDTRSVHLFLGR